MWDIIIRSQLETSCHFKTPIYTCTKVTLHLVGHLEPLLKVSNWSIITITFSYSYVGLRLHGNVEPLVSDKAAIPKIYTMYVKKIGMYCVCRITANHTSWRLLAAPQYTLPGGATTALSPLISGGNTTLPQACSPLGTTTLSLNVAAFGTPLPSGSTSTLSSDLAASQPEVTIHSTILYNRIIDYTLHIRSDKWTSPIGCITPLTTKETQDWFQSPSSTQLGEEYPCSRSRVDWP